MDTFCSAVFRRASGTSSPSSTKSRKGEVRVFLPHVTPAMRNGTKFVSKDNVYARFCLQFSNELIVSVLVRHHCLGALLKFAIFLLDRTLFGDYTAGRSLFVLMFQLY